MCTLTSKLAVLSLSSFHQLFVHIVSSSPNPGEVVPYEKVGDARRLALGCKSKLLVSTLLF